MEKEIRYIDLIETIAKDYNIELMQKEKTFYKDFPIKNGKRRIKSSCDAIIVDNDGNEHPYMITEQQRNNEKLERFNHIYVMRTKPLNKILLEAGITLKSEPCKICEGGGWYRKGTKVFYKEFTCEY